MIFSYAISPYEDWHRQAWAGGFILLTGVLLVNIVARMTLARGIHIPR
jgi:phosphate transport system permease protein